MINSKTVTVELKNQQHFYYKAWRLLWREYLIAIRQPLNAWLGIIFFLLISVAFPLAVGPEPVILRTIAPGVIWVAMLLAQLMAFDRLFQQEVQDGCLDQWLLSPYPLTLLVSIKLLGYWLFTTVPLLLVTPILGFMYYLSIEEVGILLASLVLGSPVVAVIGAIVAALVIGVQQRGLLLALILIPLYIPVLIFGSSSVILVMNDLSAKGVLSLLGALCVFALTCAPLTLAAAIRIGVEET